MGQVDVEPRNLIASYLSGRLSDAEAERFEAYWSANPRLIHEIDEVARLQDGLQGLRERGELEPLLQRSWWRGTLRFMAMAASVAALALAAWLWQSRSIEAPLRIAANPARLPAAAAVAAGASARYFMTLRSATDATVVELPAQRVALHWRILPDTGAAATRYAVTLQPRDAAAVESAVVQLAPADDGFLDLYVDSASLQPGRYLLRVQADGRSAGEFAFTVARDAGAP